MILPLAPEHAEQALAVHPAGIVEGNATFETVAPTWEAFDAAKLPEHRFVAVDADGTVLGWVAASRVSDRCAYAGVIEHFVYVHPAARGRGVAAALLKALIEFMEAAAIWTFQTGTFPRTPPASLSASGPASASSAPASGSAAITAAGVTWCSSSGAVPRSPDRRRPSTMTAHAVNPACRSLHCGPGSAPTGAGQRVGAAAQTELRTFITAPAPPDGTARTTAPARRRRPSGGRRAGGRHARPEYWIGRGMGGDGVDVARRPGSRGGHLADLFAALPPEAMVGAVDRRRRSEHWHQVLQELTRRHRT